MHAVVASQASGRVFATPQAYANEYLCPVSIGGQTLMMNFDTGSADFWMFSRYMNASQVGSHTAYNPRLSPTFHNNSKSTWSIVYADGSGASGLVGTDTVKIGAVTQKQQVIELATQVDQNFENDVNSDGIIGLGFAVLNQIRPKPALPFFQKVKASLAKRVFSVNLKEDGSGFYEFGQITPGAYTGALTRVPCYFRNGWWELLSTAYQIGGTTYTATNPSHAIAGTSLLPPIPLPSHRHPIP